MPSAADATALACARPQRPEAIAMEKPALIGTQWPSPPNAIPTSIRFSSEL